MSLFNKSTLTIAVAAASIGFSQVGSAAVSAYSQDFTGFDLSTYLGPDIPAIPPFQPAVEGEGWEVFADVWNNYSGDATDPFNNPAFTGTPNYGYGPFAAPNGVDDGTGTLVPSGGFSNIAEGEGDGPYLSVYSDYNNGDHATPLWINTSVFQQTLIDAADIGSSWTFSGIFKSPSSGGIDDQLDELLGFDITAFPNFYADTNAYIKTIDPNSGYALTNAVIVDTTGADQTWQNFSVSIDLTDPALEGQILQFGFNTVATGYQNSGVYYDNLNFDETAVIPVPAAAWLFGSALLGLAGIGRKRRAA